MGNVLRLRSAPTTVLGRRGRGLRLVTMGLSVLAVAGAASSQSQAAQSSRASSVAFRSTAAAALFTVIEASATQADGKIVVVGSTGSDSLGRVARFNADGTPDAAFNTNTATTLLDQAMRSVAIQADGKIVAGGSTYLNHLVRFNADGTADSDFNTNAASAVRESPVSLQVQTDGKILIGCFMGDGSSWLQRLNADGTLDRDFATNIANAFRPTNRFGTFPYVSSVVLQADGKILAGGEFVGQLKRFNSDGTADTAFNTSAAAAALDGEVAAIALQADGKIVAGGNFAGRLVRFNADGTADTAFNRSMAAAAPLGWVNSVAVQTDGKILAGGDTPPGFLIRVNADGTSDTRFNTRTATATPDGAVNCVMVQADATIFACGAFTERLKQFQPTGDQLGQTPEARTIVWPAASSLTTKRPVTTSFRAAADTTYAISAAPDATKGSSPRVDATKLGTCKITINRKKQRIASCRIRLTKAGSWLISITPTWAGVQGAPLTKAVTIRARRLR